MKISQKSIVFTFLPALLIANALFLKFNAFRTFNFFDMNIFLDGGWRLYQGQKPYVDFIIATGPVHYNLMALFHFIFGFGKTSIWMHLVVVHSTVILATFFMLYKKAPLWAAALAAIVTTTCFYWPISFPWYSQSAHLWGILAVAVLTQSFTGEKSKHTLLAAFFCGLMVGLSGMTKQNIGFFYAVLFLIVLVTTIERERSIPAYIAGILISVAGVFLLLVPSFSGFMEQVIFGASQFRTYLLDNVWHKPYLIFYNYYWIAALLVILKILFVAPCKNRPLLILFFGVWVVGALSTFTSGSIYQSDNQLMGVYLGLAFLIICSDKDGKIFKTGLLILTICLIVLYTYYGLVLRGWSKPYNTLYTGVVNPTGDYALKSEPLKGWLVEKTRGETVDEMAAFIQKNIPKKDSLLILTDLELLYCLTGRDSYKGITLGFVDNNWPIPGVLQHKVRDNILSRLPDWIITHKGRIPYGTNTLEYLGIKQAVIKRYALAKSFGNYVLLRRLTNPS